MSYRPEANVICILNAASACTFFRIVLLSSAPLSCYTLWISPGLSRLSVLFSFILLLLRHYTLDFLCALGSPCIYLLFFFCTTLRLLSGLDSLFHSQKFHFDSVQVTLFLVSSMYFTKPSHYCQVHFRLSLFLLIFFCSGLFGCGTFFLSPLFSL